MMEVEVKLSTRPEHLAARGVWTGCVDKAGKRVHIGDVLYFAEREWGSPGCFFEVGLYQGCIDTCGGPGDWSNWCYVITASKEVATDQRFGVAIDGRKYKLKFSRGDK